jgi:hypothetical protein
MVALPFAAIMAWSGNAGRVSPDNVTPAQNRVTPTGDIEAIPLRCAWTGNRGILHSGREIVRFHAGDLWIACALEFRGRWHEQWRPHHYTFLYFYDEAVSFAAGHRRVWSLSALLLIDAFLGRFGGSRLREPHRVRLEPGVVLTFCNASVAVRSGRPGVIGVVGKSFVLVGRCR